MPSLMVHLLTAYKYNPDAPITFYIGSIAPDAVMGRERKDKSHFRNIENRLPALSDYASGLDLTDEFSVGILLHLFLDYKWDTYAIRRFIDEYESDEWFFPYRNETALTSSWLYHNKDWSKRLWDEMAQYPKELYPLVDGIVNEDVHNLIIRNRDWHAENNIGPSLAFTPEFIEEFTDNAVTEFALWLKNLKDKNI